MGEIKWRVEQTSSTVVDMIPNDTSTDIETENFVSDNSKKKIEENHELNCPYSS